MSDNRDTMFAGADPWRVSLDEARKAELAPGGEVADWSQTPALLKTCCKAGGR